MSAGQINHPAATEPASYPARHLPGFIQFLARQAAGFADGAGNAVEEGVAGKAAQVAAVETIAGRAIHGGSCLGKGWSVHPGGYPRNAGLPSEYIAPGAGPWYIRSAPEPQEFPPVVFLRTRNERAHMNPKAFSSLHLKIHMVKNLASLGYAEMTPVQAHSLPPILAGKDVIAKAKTGSGKTAAFGIGLLTRLEPSSFRVQALVLCPTRELADQVGKELRRLARFTDNIKILTLCGGVPFGPQMSSLED